MEGAAVALPLDTMHAPVSSEQPTAGGLGAVGTPFGFLLDCPEEFSLELIWSVIMKLGEALVPQIQVLSSQVQGNCCD